MRNKIRVYALAFSIFVALAVPAFAATGDEPKSEDNFFIRLTDAIIYLFDESKIVYPPG